MNQYAVRATDLGKQYRIGEMVSGYQTLRDTIADGFSRLKRLDLTRQTYDTIWALKDVSFEVPPGRTMGIIGKNGAGKTTLLKILSRVTEPTSGKVEIQGRVGSLLEVGTGFHPELTGRENIYLNGAILGMKRAEIGRRFDEIVDFSEVEEFIDTPVKRYSIGMYLRLAFAVAAHLEPEILLVDEVLAVGDAEFQRKCLGKMSDVAEEGRTVFFVSHNMGAILRLTEETIVIDGGKMVMRAPTPEAVDYYMTSGLSQSGERVWHAGEISSSNATFTPLAIRVLNQKGEVMGQIPSNQPFYAEIEYELKQPVTGLRIGIYLSTSRGEPIFTSFDLDDNEAFENHPVRRVGRHRSRCKIPANYLNAGRYVLGMNASVYRIRSYFTDEHAITFTVDAVDVPGSHWPERRRGPLRPALEWELSDAQ